MKKEVKESLGELFLGLVKACVLTVNNIFAWGFIVYKFIQWFINPVFENVPSVTYYQAIGLSMFISLFNVASPRKVKKEYLEDEKTQYSYIFLYPWTALLIGYIAYSVIN